MERTSYMLAVPAEEKELDEPELLIKRISEMNGVQVIKAELRDAEIEVELIYNDTLYCARLYPTEFELPQFFRMQHFFPDVDIDAVEKRHKGLSVALEFAGNALISYHLQIKMIDAMFSCGVLAVLDSSAEKILSGRWIALAASSNVPPAPRYLFTVQAVCEEDGDDVWLHSHGLNRCGVTELEVLGSTRDNYNAHYQVIEGMANRLLELEEPLQPKEPLFLARLSEEVVLVTTLLPWETAICFYDEDILGGKEDRVDGYNADTSCIFAYPSAEDLKQERMAPISIYDEILEKNSIFMFSESETARMKALAQERISYVKRVAGNKDIHILVKIGLSVDGDNPDGSQKEHIWFELKEISDLSVTAELTQEPYYIAGLHAGDIGEYPIDMITDWIIYEPKRRVTPDDVYLLEL